MKVISAHREPDVFVSYAQSAESRGIEVIIAGAGGAAHLPGMCAAMFTLPVIGVPIHTKSLGGCRFFIFYCSDAFGYSVATVAINGAANAAILAAKMLAITDTELRRKLVDYKEDLKRTGRCKRREVK